MDHQMKAGFTDKAAASMQRRQVINYADDGFNATRERIMANMDADISAAAVRALVTVPFHCDAVVFEAERMIAVIKAVSGVMEAKRVELQQAFRDSVTKNASPKTENDGTSDSVNKPDEGGNQTEKDPTMNEHPEIPAVSEVTPVEAPAAEQKATDEAVAQVEPTAVDTAAKEIGGHDLNDK
jgi:hypothetical protein